MRRRYLLALATVTALVVLKVTSDVGAAPALPMSQPSRLDAPGQVLAAYASLPLTFIENRGQVDSRVRFYAQGSRYAFHFTRDAAVLSLMPGSQTSPDASVVLALQFLGANPHVGLDGEDQAAGKLNYLRGNDPSRWRTHVPQYSRVIYRQLWPGVDMLLRGDAGTLKYEFRVRPGARVSDIRLGYAGADGIVLDDDGGLRIQTSLGVLRDSPPVTYQTIAGVRVPVQSRYALQRSRTGALEFGFRVEAGYRRDHELIIDPGLDYSTFLGGSSHESGAAVTVDASGNAYITGITQSPNFPTTSGAFDRTGSASNNLDAFVTKLNSNGTALIYSTFLGGSNFEWGRGLAVDAAGNAYVAGQTKSSDFPTTSGAFDRTFNIDVCPRCGIDQYDAFVAKLNPSGSGLVYSTFLGGFDLDDALAIAIDGTGNAYIGGETGSSNFPTTPGAFDTSRNGAFDAFVTKLNPAGSALVYSSLLGGLEVDYVQRVAVDASGAAYVAGPTRSADFPTTTGAFDTTHNGAFDAFLLKLNPVGSALLYSTFLGGLDMDFPGGLAIDADGNAYVSGGTMSPDYPTTSGALDRTLDGSDAFVTKMNATGSARIYSTLLGGAGGEGASALALEGGNAWIAGGTDSTDFPTTADGFDTSFNGTSDAFVAKIDGTGSVLLYSTFLGGTLADSAADLVLDAGDNVIVTGQTVSADFPTTAGAFDRVFNGDPLIFWADAFVTKLAVGDPLPPPPTPPPTPAAPSLLSPAQDATPAQPVTLVWSDVAHAASYQVQVDNTSPLASPFIANQTVAASQVTLSGLPAQRLWWRVRAANSDGVFGPFSSTRSFTPQGSTSAAALSALSFTPSTVVGGNTSTGRVTLTSAAPTGGVLVSLASSNGPVVSVPPSITVAAGATSATFLATTVAVQGSTPVPVSGTYNGVTRTATLTVTPPGQTVSLTVTATGRSGERVISSPAGINVPVGSTGSALFATGTVITLSVSNGRDAIWSGACSSNGNKTRQCTFTLNGAVSVTANVQ